MDWIDIDTLRDEITSIVVNVAPKLVGAVVILAVGWITINWFKRRLHRFFERSDFDEALETFLESFITIMLRIVLVVFVVSMLGVQTSSLVAVLGAASLAVGLALQGSLSNFAGGVLILVFKPFKVGDYIEAQGVDGTVKKIEIFNTILASLDNKKIVLPNGNLSNDVITNYTFASTRRHDIIISIGYEDNIEKAKQVIFEVLQKNELIHTEPEPTVGVSSLADSAIELQVRFWAHLDDFLSVKYWFLETIKKEFDTEGITIPYPHITVQSPHSQ